MSQINTQKHLLKDKSSIAVRTIRVEDAEAYLELGKSILAEEIYSLTCVDELNMTLEEEKKWIQSNLDNPNNLIIVAEFEGKLVGQLDFSNGHRRRIAHTGEFGMGVRKDFRDKGVGSLILKALIDWAKNHDVIEKINLRVHHTNNRAIKMYEKHGFIKEGVRLKELKYEGQYVDMVLMRLYV